MGYKKEMKLISIPKTKNEALLDWFLTEIHWAKLAETLNYSKAGIFKLKKRVGEYREDQGDFPAIAHNFNIIELNKLIELYNYFVQHPEEFEKPKTKRELRIEEQEKIAEKTLKEMNMTYESKYKG